MEFLRALPVLPVHDLDAETAFYERLTFHVQHRDDDFVALERDRALFGLRRVDADVTVPPPGLSWQFEVDDVPGVLAAALAAGVVVHEEPQRQPSGDWTLRLQTPAGYELVVEGPASSPARPDLRALALTLPEVVELQEEGWLEYRRVGGPWIARISATGVEVRTGGVTAVDLARSTSDHLEELLRAAWRRTLRHHRTWGPCAPSDGCDCAWS
ncbi:VOC family protein [Kineococcus sp. SYSU DK003]|uniref:VOC family protein n=1 Tax=Kineococcus sp. SYSU DK003 TaxID=3383124 RepID=UPI003D7DA87F